MKSKHLTILIIVLLVALGVYVVAQDEESSTERSISLLAGVDSSKITTMVLESGEDKVELKLVDGSWSLPARRNYQADPSKVRAFMLKLFDLSSSQQINAGAEGLKELGLVEDELKNGYSRVTFLDAEGDELGGLFLGKVRAPKAEPSQMPMGMPVSSSGQFVRSISDTTARLIAMPVSVQASVEHWLDTDLLNVLRAEVVKIVSKDAQGAELYRLARVNDSGELDLGAEFSLQGPLADKKEEASQVAQLSGALESLKLADVMPVSEVEFKDPTRITEFFTKNGLVYTIESLKKQENEEEKILAKVSLGFDSGLAAELKAYETRMRARLEEEKAEKEIEEMQEAKKDASSESKLEDAKQSEQGATSAEDGKGQSIGTEEDKPGEVLSAKAKEEGAQEVKTGKLTFELPLSSAEVAKQEGERLTPWVFEIPTYQGGKFQLSVEDLIEIEKIAEKEGGEV